VPDGLNNPTSTLLKFPYGTSLPLPKNTQEPHSPSKEEKRHMKPKIFRVGCLGKEIPYIPILETKLNKFQISNARNMPVVTEYSTPFATVSSIMGTNFFNQDEAQFYIASYLTSR
jgi:hypothetical protein